MTDQHIHLWACYEAIHTPSWATARSPRNARYIMNTARHLGGEIVLDRRCRGGARDVLAGCERLLERVSEIGLMKAIESAVFADVSRRPEEAAASKASSSALPLLESLYEAMVRAA